MAEIQKTQAKRKRKRLSLTDEIKSLLPQCMLQDQVRLGNRFRKLLGNRQRDTKALIGLKKQALQSVRLMRERQAGLPEITYPEELPLTAKKDEILEAIQKHPVVIVAGETGSGKTTQLPKICLEAGRGIVGKVACTQPRRVAALSVSRRIAEELGVPWGREVGCKIRFKDETTPQTYIKMMTDGMLLAEIQGDPDLFEYDTIIIDEAHERSLNIDFLLGYLQILRKRRPGLKILITSATIDTEMFSKAFDDAPVIEVSGRVFPVDVEYWPMEDLLGEGDDYTYIDAAVTAVDHVMEESQSGDILMFMPTEKDIHETRRKLEGRQFRFAEILPLFGRLTPKDQQRVFHVRGGTRRIVVATNVAETSLTIPGIKYVIDTGMARMSRYNPRNQTHRLPIEPISQSSAKQRAGRCGRVSGGICIRLYDEKDFGSRPVYTQPEIQRSNLAEVILRMLALRLGDVETFPFLDPPRSQAIQGGFLLLKELGAMGEDGTLTEMGKDMARMPIAPTVARMILQARKEHALREVMVIASAISIQDPRVRPLGEEKQADTEHRKFVHPESDFLALLNIWNAFHDRLEEMKTQSAMRRFCRQHYLSYNRMREWRDIYMQIRQTLREIGGFRWNRKEADYDDIHRSVVTGLFSNIAQKKEHNLYRAARARDVMIFPGSGLFQRKTKENDEKQPRTPGWLAAGEIVETSRVFARTVARIQPGWLSELGAHLCRASYKEPFFSPRSGRVLVTETLTLYGLQVQQKRVAYQHVDSKDATEIFIREALVNDEVALPLDFLVHNRELRERVETWQMRNRGAYGLDIDEAVYAYYARHLNDVSSVHELNRLVRDKKQTDPEFLYLKEADLVGEEEVEFDRNAFPEYLEVNGEQVRLAYAYKPGQDEDGVTVQMSYKLVHFVQPEVLEWLVPGLLHEKITYLLRGLPKRIRKQFVPVPDTAREIVARLQPTHRTFLDSLEVYIGERYGVTIQRADWRPEELPDFLRMRVEVQGIDGEAITASRDLSQVVDHLDQHEAESESAVWRQAAQQWEQVDVKGWTFGDLPEQVEVTQMNGMPVFGYPGLRVEEGKVCVRLFPRPDEAERESREGLTRLYELVLKDELKGLKRELQDLKQVTDLALFEGGSEAFREAAYAYLVAYLFERTDLYPLTQERFEMGMADALTRMRGLVSRFIGQVVTLFETYREVRLMGEVYSGMEADVARLVDGDFLARTPFAQLPHLVRYVKAVKVRAERARMAVGKDRQKVDQVQPFQDALDEVLKREAGVGPRRWSLVTEFRWMLEEYRVSIFAQELGTARSVSLKRLNTKLEEIRRLDV